MTRGNKGKTNQSISITILKETEIIETAQRPMQKMAEWPGESTFTSQKERETGLEQEKKAGISRSKATERLQRRRTKTRSEKEEFLLRAGKKREQGESGYEKLLKAEEKRGRTYDEKRLKGTTLETRRWRKTRLKTGRGEKKSCSIPSIPVGRGSRYRKRGRPQQISSRKKTFGRAQSRTGRGPIRERGKEGRCE